MQASRVMTVLGSSALPPPAEPDRVAALATGIALLGFFVANEMQATHSTIMPLRLFASLERRTAHLARLLYLSGMLRFWFFVASCRCQLRTADPHRWGRAFQNACLSNGARIR